MEKLICTCDWCNIEKEVHQTTYGTTNYIRLICIDCSDRIEKNEYSLFGCCVNPIRDCKPKD